MSLSTGGYDSQGTPNKDTDEDDPMTSLLKAQIPVCDCDEGVNAGRSHELPPRDPPLDIIKECSDEMEVTNTEGDAHQCVTDNNVCSDHAAPETRVHTPNPDPSLPYLTPDSNPPDTPTPPRRGVVRPAEVTSSDILTPNNIQRQSLSKLQRSKMPILG